MRKHDELTHPDSCMSRARDDEWTFVLLGRDVAAPAAVRAWIDARIRLGKNRRDDPQITEAMRWIDAVEAEQAEERLRRSFRGKGMSYPYANDGGLAMSSKKYQKPERVDVEAEILAGVREVEALRGTGPGPGSPPAPEGAPAGPVEADREQGVTRS